ncbi:MAG: SUMF1/EgtB/PvdO family nonheme iron enzyme [Chloroflexota bacterium]
MGFDLDTWKAQLAQRLPGWRARMQRAGVDSVYAFISAAALWPVVEAARGGEWAALAELGKVAAAVGTNLLANQIQNWKDESDAARQLQEAASQQPDLRNELDAVLQKLEAISLAGARLSEAERDWFVNALRAELQQAGSALQIVEGDYLESGAIQVNLRVDSISNVSGGQVNLAGRDVIHNYASPGDDPAALRRAYLERIVAATSHLSLSGIDPKAASEAGQRLDLGAVYTALLTLTSGEHSRGERGEVAPERSPRRLSALALLDREARLVLLGDPGSGKSTFVNFVALCLAGEALGRPDANLALLKAPLPPDEDERRKGDEKPAAQPWSHAALLPVRVILRDFAARGLPEPGQPAAAKHLWDFIAAELRAAALGDFEKHLVRELRQSGGLLLLDGLDEVPEAGQRRAQIKACVDEFAKAFPRCRILVTSRTYAYQKQDWRLPGFTEAVLAPFSRGQIEQFVERWYAHIGGLRGLPPADAQGRAELLKRAIVASDRLYALAERPLLLTLMASLHAWRGGSLPEKREELYSDTVDLLLDWWESPKVVRDARGQVLDSQPSLAEWLKVDRQKVRELLNRLAFEAHAAQPDLQGTADVAEGDLVTGLLELSKNPDTRPARLVEYLSARAGLLLPRGASVYTFPHRTFQEYLAACYLTDHDFPEGAADLVCQDFNRWREVVLLAGAKAARGTASAIWSLVDALCYQDAPQSPGDWQSPGDLQGDLTAQWAAHLAGQALVETVNLEGVSERNRPKVQRTQRWLAHLLRSGALPALERARAGDSLARLGDPRFDPARWYLPAEPLLGFVHIPAGPFRMGSDKRRDSQADDDELPQHEVRLEDYWLGRFPVTVAQFRAFVQDSRHRPQEKRSLEGLDNHPVVYVTWYDAIAYCQWLSGKLQAQARRVLQGGGPALDEISLAFWQGLAQGNLQVTLPSEAEWEKAARGADGRTYPWGDDFDPDKTNTVETGIGGASTVGCFPAGASLYGLLDLSGDVWEWTRSIFKDYPYNPGDGREALKGNDLRVLRGGSFGNYRRNARCAHRYRNLPVNWDMDRGVRAGVVPLPLGSGGSGSLGL